MADRSQHPCTFNQLPIVTENGQAGAVVRPVAATEGVEKMSKFFVYTATLLAGLAASAMLGKTGSTGNQRLAEARLASDGAYRDGLYVGRLTAEAGRGSHPPVGRWSTNADRASFIAGYRQAYGESVSHSGAHSGE